MKSKILFTLFFLCINMLAIAQTPSSDVEMADIMRSNGKIYIVVAIVAVIFAGIIIYLISLDSKISKIEKRINSSK